jgi:hypothetical protein
MDFQLSPENIEKIGNILGVEPKQYGHYYRMEITGEDDNHRISLEIYPNIAIGSAEGALITVYTPNSNIQLQHCSGVVLSELMEEVTFVAEFGSKVHGLIIEKGGSCSMYSNVDKAMLSGDFTQLGPEVMLSGVALSLTEIMLPDLDDMPGEKGEE